MFWVIVHLYYEAPPSQLCCIWLNLGREYAMHAHAITLLLHVSQMMLYTLDNQLFQAFSILFFSPSFWYRLILISAIQRMLFQKWSGFFRCFLAKSNLALFAPCGESEWALSESETQKSEPSVFALVKSSLDCRLWQWYTSRRVFFSWLDVVKGFFFFMVRILRSSTTVVLRGHPYLFMLLSSLVVLFFSECSKLLIWYKLLPLRMFLLSL